VIPCPHANTLRPRPFR